MAWYILNKDSMCRLDFHECILQMIIVVTMVTFNQVLGGVIWISPILQWGWWGNGNESH